MGQPGPNEPCHCGSGRRYKRCCASEDRAVRKQRRTLGRVLLVVAIVVGVGVGLEAMRRSTSSGEPEFRYDAANDRYWHAEHGHWHDGPPPGGGAATLDPADVPEPWQYDASGHRHWHPDHAHWHEGFPPPGKGAPVPFAGPRPPEIDPPPVAEPPPSDVDYGVSEQPPE